MDDLVAAREAAAPRAEAGLVEVETVGLLRLSDEPGGALGLAASAARRRFPGRLGRRAALRAARRRADELVDRHAGRLRSAISGAVEEACRSLEARRRSALAESLRLVEDAVASAELSRLSLERRDEEGARDRVVLQRARALRRALEEALSGTRQGISA